MKIVMKAIVLDSWEEVQEWFNAGWFYVDCKITVDKGKTAFHFVLTQENSNRVIINRSRK